jgi:hypothetical protein
LPGLGIFVVCLRLGTLLTRFGKTLDEVDRQVAALSVPVVQTLSHVGGIADTADVSIARLGDVVGQLETAAGSVVKTAALAGEALTPTIVNVGATLTGLSAGLRRLARGKNPEAGSP